MRTLQLAILALATAASTGSVWADSVDIFALFGGVAGEIGLGGEIFSNTYWGSVIYGTPGPPYHVTGDPTYSYITSGPLIAANKGEWLFDGGGHIQIYAEFFADFSSPIPTGQSCEDIGLGGPDPVSGGFCSVAEPRDVTGSFSGPVTVSVEPYPPIFGGPYRLEISGPVTFDLGAGLAFAMGVSTGPYFGTLDETFNFFLLDPIDNPDALYTDSAEPNSFEVTGSTVPEPSTFLLLATVVVGVGCYHRRTSRQEMRVSKTAV